MALDYDALFLRRHGFDAVAEPLESDFAADAAIVLAVAGRRRPRRRRRPRGGAFAGRDRRDDGRRRTARPGPVADPGGTGLPVADRGTAGHRRAPGPDAAALRRPAPAQRRRLPAGIRPPRLRRGRPGSRDPGGAPRAARRLRLQAPPWEAPLQIVPGRPHPGPDRRLGTAVRGNRRLPARDRRPAPHRCGRAPAPGLAGGRPVHPVVHRRGQPAASTPTAS